MISVIGSEVTSAFLKSSSNALFSALSALASPNSSTRKPRVGALHGLDRRQRPVHELLRLVVVARDLER